MADRAAPRWLVRLNRLLSRGIVGLNERNARKALEIQRLREARDK